MAVRTNSHSVQQERVAEARSTESFNRVDYALSLLKLLNLPLRVAVYRRSQRLLLERGGGLGDEGPWAIFGVPPHATRESIARAVAELSGRAGEPFLIDLLCATRVNAAD